MASVGKKEEGKRGMRRAGTVQKPASQKHQALPGPRNLQRGKNCEERVSVPDAGKGSALQALVAVALPSWAGGNPWAGGGAIDGDMCVLWGVRGEGAGLAALRERKAKAHGQQRFAHCFSS